MNCKKYKWKCEELFFNKTIFLSDDGVAFAEALLQVIDYKSNWTLISIEIPSEFLKGDECKNDKWLFIKATSAINKFFPKWIVATGYNSAIYVDIFYKNFGICDTDISLDIDPEILLFNFFKSLKLKIFS